MSPAPDATRMGHIDTLVRALKTAGVWTKMDALYLFAAHNSQAALLNWKGATYNATATNSPTFAADRGYTGASTKYIETGYVVASQNAFSLGAWSRTAASEAICGATSGGVYTSLWPRFGGATSYAYVNNGVSGPAQGATDGVGFYQGIRTASNAYSLRRNAAEVSAAVTASSTPPTPSIWFLGMNGTDYYTGQCSGGYLAPNGFTTTEANDTYNAIAAYMTAVGA